VVGVGQAASGGCGAEVRATLCVVDPVYTKPATLLLRCSENLGTMLIAK
jgi:hypothetical protein